MTSYTGKVFALAATIGLMSAQTGFSAERAECLIPMPDSNTATIALTPECAEYRVDPSDPRFDEPVVPIKRKRA